MRAFSLKRDNFESQKKYYTDVIHNQLFITFFHDTISSLWTMILFLKQLKLE